MRNETGKYEIANLLRSDYRDILSTIASFEIKK
jgi:hypothetical protein